MQFVTIIELLHWPCVCVCFPFYWLSGECDFHTRVRATLPNWRFGARVFFITNNERTTYHVGDTVKGKQRLYLHTCERVCFTLRFITGRLVPVYMSEACVANSFLGREWKVCSTSCNVTGGHYRGTWVGDWLSIDGVEHVAPVASLACLRRLLISIEKTLGFKG